MTEAEVRLMVVVSATFVLVLVLFCPMSSNQLHAIIISTHFAQFVYVFFCVRPGGVACA